MQDRYLRFFWLVFDGYVREITEEKSRKKKSHIHVALQVILMCVFVLMQEH